MDCYRVSKLVNSAKNDSPECLAEGIFTFKHRETDKTPFQIGLSPYSKRICYCFNRCGETLS